MDREFYNTNVVTLQEVEKFIRQLEKSTAAKVLRTRRLLSQFGIFLGMPHSKRVSKDLYELRIRGDQEVRIFYTFRQQQAFLVHGFVKKTQKTPDKVIKQALKRIRSLD